MRSDRFSGDTFIVFCTNHTGNSYCKKVRQSIMFTVNDMPIFMHIYSMMCGKILEIG